MLLLQGYSNNVACQLLLWNRWCYLPSPWNCPKNIPKGHTGSHWMGLKHLRASNIYIKKKKDIRIDMGKTESWYFTMELLEANMTEWRWFWAQIIFSISVWLRTFFQLCTWTYLPYLVYKIRNKRMVLVPNLGINSETNKKCKADVSLQRCDMTYLCADFGCYRSTGESTPKTWLWMVGYSKCWQHRYSAVVGCKNKKAKELI